MSRCFAIGCKVQVPSSRFGCLKHWRMLPKPFQDEVWTAYRAKDRNRTLELARDAMEMVANLEKRYPPAGKKGSL